MTPRRLGRRPSLDALVARVDTQPRGAPSSDTIATGFASLDKMLGGGLRRRDLVVLGGDVGAGKSALALGIALRVAQSATPVGFLSGEMDEERLLERAMAIEGRVAVDDLRAAKISIETRAAMGAAAVRLRNLPLTALPLSADTVDEALDRLDPLREIKAFAIARQVATLVVAQLPRFDRMRPDRRPSLDDYGHLGAVKQHADVVLSLYREEMYNPGAGVEGATDLIVSKNRNGPTGFVDLYFFRRWMRFEDMLDPDR